MINYKQITQEWLDKHYPGRFEAMEKNGVSFITGKEAVILKEVEAVREKYQKYLSDKIIEDGKNDRLIEIGNFRKDERLFETLKEDIENRFSYHQPKTGQQERYAKITEAFKELALLVADLTPESREQSVALTLLWEARMAANGAIAINE